MISNRLVLLAIVLFNVHAFAAEEALTKDLNPKEKTEWTTSRCKWFVTGSPEFVGYTAEAESSDICFVFARYNFVSFQNDPAISKETKAIFHNKITVIFDDHHGNTKTCNLVPVKDEYDNVTEDEFTEAYLDGSPELDQMIQKLNNNLKLDCKKLSN
jgi:hypothetical protein